MASTPPRAAACDSPTSPAPQQVADRDVVVEPADAAAAAQRQPGVAVAAEGLELDQEAAGDLGVEQGSLGRADRLPARSAHASMCRRPGGA